jgi:hypothetical protein
MNTNSKFFRILSVITMIAVPSMFLNGCAAGNYGLTRTVAKWNLKMSVVPRVLIYIAFVIIPVYGLATLFDLVINNTIEFWSGKAAVTAKNEIFEQDGHRVEVAHSMSPLKRSEFKSYDQKGMLLATTVFAEEQSGEISVFVDGVKRGQVKEIDQNIIQMMTFNGQERNISATQEFDAMSFGELNASNAKEARANLDLVSAKIGRANSSQLSAFAVR